MAHGSNKSQMDMPDEIVKVLQKMQVIGQKSASFGTLVGQLQNISGPEDALRVLQIIHTSAGKARSLSDALLDYADAVEEAFMLPEDTDGQD